MLNVIVTFTKTYVRTQFLLLLCNLYIEHNNFNKNFVKNIESEIIFPKKVPLFRKKVEPC